MARNVRWAKEKERRDVSIDSKVRLGLQGTAGQARGRSCPALAVVRYSAGMTTSKHGQLQSTWE